MYMKIQKAATLLNVSYNTILKWVREAGLRMQGKGIKGEGREVPFHALLIYLYKRRKLWYLREEKGSKQNQNPLLSENAIKELKQIARDRISSEKLNAIEKMLDELGEIWIEELKY